MTKVATTRDLLAAPDQSVVRVDFAEACAKLGLDLTSEQKQQLLKFLALLLRWNAVYNLTGMRDPERMLTHHVLDCLAVVEPLNRFLASTLRPTFLDVGSGAGLPGAVLAIADPGLRVSCIDAVGKKAAFVNQVAAELSLSNLASIHGRVERLHQNFEVVGSRAFASLASFTALTRQCLAEQGVWFAMKGTRPSAEIEALPSAVEVFHVEQVAIPGVEAERCLVWMRPSTLATAAYLERGR